MENIKCTKCKNAVICKFRDSLDEVTQTFPFIESFSCRYYESATTKKLPVPENPQTEAGQIKKQLIETSNKALEKPKKDAAFKTEKPSETETTEKKRGRKPSSSATEAFKGLDISNLGLTSDLKERLGRIGIKTVGDLYKNELKKNILKDDIAQINSKLSIFNQQTI